MLHIPDESNVLNKFERETPFKGLHTRSLARSFHRGGIIGTRITRRRDASCDVFECVVV